MAKSSYDGDARKWVGTCVVMAIAAKPELAADIARLMQEKAVPKHLIANFLTSLGDAGIETVPGKPKAGMTEERKAKLQANAAKARAAKQAKAKGEKA